MAPHTVRQMITSTAARRPTGRTSSASDPNLVVDGPVPLPNQSLDYVLEHILDPGGFAAEVRRLLKLGRSACARRINTITSRSVRGW